MNFTDIKKMISSEIHPPKLPITKNTPWTDCRVSVENVTGNAAWKETVVFPAAYSSSSNELYYLE